MRKTIAAVMALLFILVLGAIAFAGSSQTSKADLCHWDRTGPEPERHRHLPNTKTPGWTCGEKGSGDFKVIPGSGADLYIITDKRRPAVLEPCGKQRRAWSRIKAMGWPDATWKDEARAARVLITCMRQQN